MLGRYCTTRHMRPVADSSRSMPVPFAKLTRADPYEGATRRGTVDVTDVRGIADAGVDSRNGSRDGSTSADMVAAHRCRSRTNAPASHSEANCWAAPAAADSSAPEALSWSSLAPDGAAVTTGMPAPWASCPRTDGSGDDLAEAVDAPASVSSPPVPSAATDRAMPTASGRRTTTATQSPATVPARRGDHAAQARTARRRRRMARRRARTSTVAPQAWRTTQQMTRRPR